MAGADQRLQQVFFPHGYSLKMALIEPSKTSMIFYELEEISGQKEGLVALPGIEPGFED